MQLPIGMLIYKAQRLSDEESKITGIWYFQEMFVPTTRDEKIQSKEDLKKRRCTGLILTGTYDQICDVIMQSDAFSDAKNHQVEAYAKLLAKLESSTNEYVFDEFMDIKGTALSVDTSVEVNDNMDTVRSKINAWKMVEITIAKKWSGFSFLKG